MPSRKTSMRLLMLAALAACGDNVDNMPPDGPPADGPPDAPACEPSTAAATVIFLNRGGGTYTSGATSDSSTNVTPIIEAANSPTTLVAPTIVESDWTEVRTCLDELFAPFNVMLTETDPGVAEHQELVVIDNSAQIDVGNGVTALSPTVPCEAGTNAPVPVAKGVTFLIWAAFGSVPNANRLRCEGAAQAVAVTLGLDHGFSCPDVLTFLTGCGDKSFTDADVPCGEDQARACRCGGNTQNSFQYLAELLGRTCEDAP